MELFFSQLFIVLLTSTLLYPYISKCLAQDPLLMLYLELLRVIDHSSKKVLQIHGLYDYGEWDGWVQVLILQVVKALHQKRGYV